MIESNNKLRVREFASLRRLGLIDADSVVDWAVERVADAPANGAMVRIACERVPSDSLVIDNLLNELLIEAGDRPLSEDEAGWTVARLLAEQIVDEWIEPVSGAKQIWLNVGTKVPALEPRLRIFTALPSLWEDDPAHRAEYERDIVAAAAQLLDDVKKS
jgi:hypothetical protein